MTAADAPARVDSGPDAGGNSLPDTQLEPGSHNRLDRWISSRSGAYGRAFLVGALALAPIAVDVGASDAFALVKITVLWCCGTLALGCALTRSAPRRGKARLGLVGWGTVTFLLVYIATTAASTSPRLSIFGLPGRYGGLVPMLLYAGLMYACTRLYRDEPQRLRALAWAVTAGSAFVAVYVCIQAAGLDPAHWTDPSTGLRPDWPVGTLGNSNFAGGHLAIALPLCIYLATTQRRVALRAALTLLAGVEALALWYTQTRGGLIAAGVAICVMVAFARRQLPRWVSVATFGAAAASVLAAVFVIWHPGFDKAPGALDRVRTSTLESRLEFWRVGVSIAIDHPLTGTGPDTFYAQYPPRRSAAAARKQGLILADKPHNIFVEYAADIGLIGLASYVVILAGTIAAAWRTLRRNREVVDPLLLGFLGALVAYVVQSFFSIDEPHLAAMRWVCIGAVVALTRTHAEPTAPIEAAVTSRPGLRIARYAVIASSVAALLVLGIQPLRAGAAARAGDFDSAMRLQPLDASYPKDVGEHNRLVALAIDDPNQRLAYLQTADRYYQAALRLQPGDMDLMLKLAVTNSVWAESVDPTRFSQADHWWAMARRADPHDALLVAFHNDAIALMRGRASELGQLALADPESPSGWLVAAQASAAVGDNASARERVMRALALDPTNALARRLADGLPPS